MTSDDVAVSLRIVVARTQTDARGCSYDRSDKLTTTHPSPARRQAERYCVGAVALRGSSKPLRTFQSRSVLREYCSRTTANTNLVFGGFFFFFRYRIGRYTYCMGDNGKIVPISRS